MSAKQDTTTEDGNEEYRSLNVSRRGLMRRGAAAGTAVTVAGAGAHHTGVEPIEEAEAVAPLVAYGAAAAAGAAIGFLAGRVSDDVFSDGESVKEEDVLASTAEKTWGEIRARAKEISATEETVMTTLENQVASSKTVAYSEAKKRAVELMNNDATKANTKTAAVEEVDKHYSNIQLNLAEHASLQNLKAKRMMETADAEIVPNIDDVSAVKDLFSFSVGSDSAGVDLDYHGLKEVSTVVADTFNQDSFANTLLGYPASTKISSTDDHPEILVKPLPSNSGQSIAVFDSKRHADLFDTIESQHSAVVADVENLIDNIYSEYTSGDIDDSDLIGGTDLIADAPDDSLGGSSADLAALGIDGALDNQMIIELKDAGTRVKGTLFNDADLTLETGTVYDPSNLSGNIWLAYEDSDGDSGTLQLQQKFEVIEAKNLNGEDVEQIGFEETNPSDQTDQNIDELRNELKQLKEINEKLRKQQEEDIAELADSGGGGGFFGGGFDMPAWLPALGVGGVVVWYLSNQGD